MALLTLADRQDLNASILSGSSRIVDHTTFPGLQWKRDRSSPSIFRLPPGFQMRSHLLTEEFIEVLEDLHALQYYRNAIPPKRCNVLLMEDFNNHSASIQSRLAGLPNLSPVMSCCHLAAYLCSVMLGCKVWSVRWSLLCPHLTCLGSTNCLTKGFLLLLLLQIPETPAIVYHQWRLLTPYS